MVGYGTEETRTIGSIIQHQKAAHGVMVTIKVAIKGMVRSAEHFPNFKTPLHASTRSHIARIRDDICRQLEVRAFGHVADGNIVRGIVVVIHPIIGVVVERATFVYLLRQ